MFPTALSRWRRGRGTINERFAGELRGRRVYHAIFRWYRSNATLAVDCDGKAETV